VEIELNSGKLNVLDQGKGPAVLLIHAFPLHHGMWDPQLPVLSARFRVIAPDLRGFGQSRPPSPWTMEQMADDLNTLLDRLDVDTCSLAGVSIGGYIGFAFWSRYPKRVRQLVLCNTRARADNELEKNGRNEMIGAIQQNGVSILPDRMLPRLLGPNAPQDVVKKVRTMIEATDASAAIYAVTAMRDRMDFSTALHRIQTPTMVVAGEKDAIIRADEARSMADAISGSRFVQIPDSGHLSNLENPEEFNRALLGFLA
jgi:3-oxoadipate enol-lactonase